MPQGSTDITADSLVVNVNTNLSENTLIGEVTPDSLKKLNDKYSNNVKAISIQYSLSNYQDHYDSFSNWSEQAPQYWPGKFMWQRTTVTYEDGTIMRSMTCIQGAQGSAGSGATIEETYVKYAKVVMAQLLQILHKAEYGFLILPIQQTLTLTYGPGHAPDSQTAKQIAHLVFPV